jgi:hypothetical protein
MHFGDLGSVTLVAQFLKYDGKIDGKDFTIFAVF